MSADTTTNFATEADEYALLVTVTRELDGSYSVGVEDATKPEESEDRYVTGLSEGQVFDRGAAIAVATEIVIGQLMREAQTNHLSFRPYSSEPFTEAEVQVLQTALDEEENEPPMEWRNSTTGEPAFGA